MLRRLFVGVLAGAISIHASAWAGESGSTAVSVDAQTIRGNAPAASATVDATQMSNNSGAQNEPNTPLSGTSYPPATMLCGQAYTFTSTSNITLALPAIAGTQPLTPSTGCWVDVFFPTTSANTLTVRTCQAGDSPACGSDASDVINTGTPGSGATQITLYPTFWGVRFYAYPDGSGSGTWRTVGLPPSNLGTVTGYLGTARTVTSGITFAQSDCGTTIVYNSASNANFTLSAVITGFCPINVKQQGTGVVTFVAGSATFLTNPHGFTKTGGQNAMVTMENSVAAASWALQGDGQ